VVEVGPPAPNLRQWGERELNTMGILELEEHLGWGGVGCGADPVRIPSHHPCRRHPYLR
jgi:hypothetical protein